MNKLFVVSDIHSFFTPFKKALDNAGFNPEDKTHWLIVLGDAFDRGDESEEVLNFLMSLERKILVRGNHDTLLEDLCKRKYPSGYDYHNGSKKTVDNLGGATLNNSFDECCQNTLNKTARYRELLVNYFETENYIFVHSWIPLNHKGFGNYTYMQNWRDADDEEWKDAMWCNPFFHAQDRLNETGKTIVFGHWHCSLGHSLESRLKLSEFGKNACWEPCYNKEQGIIGIDRCTSHTGEVNVIVLEDEFLKQ